MKHFTAPAVYTVFTILTSFFIAAPAGAGEMEDLRALSDFQPAAWEGLQAVPDKELFSDYHIRYVVRGTVSFASNPPVFKTNDGKTFKVTRYPAWLAAAEGKPVCVEGYTRQRDDTDELVIEKILPPEAFEGLSPGGEGLQRDPEIISSGNGIYTLNNIGWEMKHDPEGKMETDKYGNFITVWKNGIKTDITKIKDVYFGKKTSLKPLRYGNHGFLIFTFEPGGVTAPDGSRTGSLIISLDAYYPDPTQMTYSPVSALRGKYQVYYGIQSGDCYAEIKFNYNEFNMSKEMVISPYPLRLNKKEKTLLLENAFKKAAGNNQGEMYSLFYNSCANSVLSLINSALPKERKIKSGRLPEIFYRMQTSLPGALAALLVREGVAGDPLPDITLDNYKDYLERLAPELPQNSSSPAYTFRNTTSDTAPSGNNEKEK